MEIKTEGMLLSAISKPYNMHGNEGVSHRVRVLVNGEIFTCKSNADMVSYLAPLVGSNGTVTLKLRSPKEVLMLECLNFSVDK